jgi:transposase
LDKSNDSDAIRDLIREHGGIAVIPPKANRSTKPAFDELVYVERHHIETLFARLKSFLRIATRYEKLHRTLSPPCSPSLASLSGSMLELYFRDTP